MVYRPPVKKSDFDGPSGLAKVVLNGNKTKAKVVFIENNEEYVISVKNCPDDVQKYIRSGEFIAKMNKDGDKLYSMSPANGMFEGKVAKFSSKKDQPPAPMTKIGADWSYLYFVVMIGITKGECQGMQLPCFLRYNFCEELQDVKGTTKSVVGYSKNLDKSKHTAFLDEFLTITGVWDFGPIAYTDNILPKLEQRTKRADKSFSFIVKKGFIDTFYQQSSLPIETKLPDEPEFADGVQFDDEDLTDDPLEEKFE